MIEYSFQIAPIEFESCRVLKLDLPDALEELMEDGTRLFQMSLAYKLVLYR